MEAYRADPTNVTFQRGPNGKKETYWVVRGSGKYKGFGRIPRFSGSKVEALVVAEALNRLSENGYVPDA